MCVQTWSMDLDDAVRGVVAGELLDISELGSSGAAGKSEFGADAFAGLGEGLAAAGEEFAHGHLFALGEVIAHDAGGRVAVLGNAVG